jgi:hypothetical protein
MAYTRKLLGFRDLASEELSAVAGGFASQLTADGFTTQPGVGGGGNNGGGLSFSVKPGELDITASNGAGSGTAVFNSDFDLTNLMMKIDMGGGDTFTVDHDFTGGGSTTFTDDHGGHWKVSVKIGDDGSITVSGSLVF